VVRFAVVMIDTERALINIQYAPPGTEAEGLQVVDFVLSRVDVAPSELSTNLLPACGFLIIFSLLKFGPRMYLKWRGLDKKPSQRMSKDDLRRRQMEILQEMKDKKLL